MKGGYLLRFDRLADFLVDRSGTEITLCHVESEVTADTLRHLVLDQALPTVLSLRGVMALHATAVATPAGACAFLGPAGSGKSTLAASFSIAGYPAIADDCLVLKEQEEFLAVPAYPGIRLWKDALDSLVGDSCVTSPVAHFTSKRRVWGGQSGSGFPRKARPLRVIYRLDRRRESGAPSVRRCSGSDALMELVSSSFFLDIADKAMLTDHFRALGRLAARVPVRVLEVPEDFSALPEVRRAVLADLEN